MSQHEDPTTEPADLPADSTLETAATRGRDDRRSTVNPADNPAPSSPQPDEEAVRKGEENLESVKPY